MQVGGERKLVIRKHLPLNLLLRQRNLLYHFFSAAALAYGKKGTQGIGPNSTLHFDVKLVTLK